MNISRTLVAVVVTLAVSLALVIPLQKIVSESLQPRLPVEPERRIWQSVEIQLAEGKKFALGDVYAPLISRDGKRGLFFVESGLPKTVELFLWEEGSGFSSLSLSRTHVLAAAVSGDGRRALWLATSLAEQGGGSLLYRWDEGASPQVISGQTFFGSWGIRLSENGGRALLFPKEERANFRAAGGGGETLGQALLFEIAPNGQVTRAPFPGIERAEQIRVEPLAVEVVFPGSDTKAGRKTIQRHRSAIRQSLDVDRDGIADVLTGVGGGPNYLWRAIPLGGVIGASPKATGSLLRTIGFQAGDPAGVPIPGDYNGDGVLDLATFSPEFVPWTNSRGNWEIFYSDIRQATAEWSPSIRPERQRSIDWGRDDIAAMPADYDGDGATDVAIFRRGDAVWEILLSSGDFHAAKGLARLKGFGQELQWGRLGDVPLVDDFDGNGYADPTVVRNFRNSKEKELRWYIHFSGPAKRSTQEFSLGTPEDTPLSGDIDGDGEADALAYHASHGAGDSAKWLVRYGNGEVGEIHWALPNGLPFVGDFDGDRQDDLAFFVPAGDDPIQVLNSRIAPKLLETAGYRPPFVTRLRYGGAKDKPVQILLREHQLGVSGIVPISPDR